MFRPDLALNTEQHAAATFEGDQLRILAGAGTGKTTALTARVAWLVTAGISPDRLMLLTFTRRAAREMVHRTEVMLAGSSASTGRRPPRPGPGRHLPLDRPPDAAPSRGRPRVARRLLDARCGRCRRRDRSRPRRAGRGGDGPPVPEEGDAARPVLALGQHPASAVDGHRRDGAVVHRSARADRVDLSRLRQPQASPRARRLRRPVALLARRRGRRAARPAAGVRGRPHLRRRVPGRQRAPGRRAARPARAATRA